MPTLWLTATSATAATDVKVSFPTPTGPPTAGAGVQKFRALLRKTTGSPNPTIDMELWETGGGSALATLLDNTAITSAAAQIVEGTWNSSLLATADGSAVQCRIVSTPGTGLGPITRTATPTSFSTTTAAVTNWGFSHNAAAGTTIILLTVLCEAHCSVSGTPTWDAGGTPQNFSLIRATTSSGTDGDMRAYIYGVIPNVTGTRTIGLTVTGTAIDCGFACAVSYLGTVTTSVAAAAIYLDEQINDTAATTVAMNEAVGGVAGRTVFAVADFQGGDGDPADETASGGQFTEIFDSATGTSTTADIAYWVGDAINWTPAAVTVDWTSTLSDENCGIVIELVPETVDVNTIEIGAVELIVDYTIVVGNSNVLAGGGMLGW